MCLVLVSCGGKNSKETGVSISLKGFLGSGAFPGGVMVYGRDFERGLFFSRYVSNGNDEVVLSNGNWVFAAVAYQGPGPLEGQVKCDATENIFLNGGEAIVNFALSTGECAKDHFGPNSFTYADGQFYDMRFVTCARPDQTEKAQNKNCQLGRAESYKITFLEAAVGPSLNPVLFGGVTSNCIGNGPTAQSYFDPATYYKIPVGSELIPVPIVITAFDSAGCTGDEENYVFGKGLQFGADDGKDRGNVSNHDQKASVFLRSDMCQGDGLTLAPFAQGAAVNPPNGNFVCTETQLQQVEAAVATNASRIFSLEEDIYLSTNFEPFMIGTAGTPFIGQFFGNDNVIYDLDIAGATANGVGFFAHVGMGAKIEDLHFNRVEIDGNGYSDVGTLIGSGTGFNIKNISVYDDPLETATDVETTANNNVGGLIGRAANGNDWYITSVSVENIKVVGVDNIGGLIGNAATPGASTASTLIDLIATNSEIEASNKVGGMIGLADLSNGSISADWDVVNTDIQIQVTSASRSGGLIGEQNASTGAGLFFGMRTDGLITVPAGSGYSYFGGMFGHASGVQGAGFFADVDFDGAGVTLGTNQYFGGIAGAGENFFAIQNARAEGAWGCNECTKVGGLVGETLNINPSSGFIGDSSAHGDVIGKQHVGGFIGTNTDPDLVIIRAYSEGNVTAPTTSSDIGGFIGYLAGAQIDNAYSDGDVTTGAASVRMGGFAGYVNAGSINYSFSFGDADGATGTQRGAFVGLASAPTFNGLFHDSTINTVSDSYSTGLSTAQMEDATNHTTTFTGYDFSATGNWTVPDTDRIPELKFENFYNTLGGFYTGSFFDPVPICNADQWNAIGENEFLAFANIKLVCDIDFSGGFNPIGSASTPFEGRLMGNDHTISNISEDNAGIDNYGLIAYADGAEVKHDNGDGGFHALYLENVEMRARDNVGLVIGYISGNSGKRTEVVNVIVDQDSSAEGADFVGGAVGYVSATATGVVAGVQYSGKVIANNSPTTAGATGGIVGGVYGTNFKVANSFVIGNGTADQISGVDNVGGVVGASNSVVSGNDGGIYQTANFLAEVHGTGTRVGGLVGYLNGDMDESFVADVEVEAASGSAGGVIGFVAAGGTVGDSFCVYCDVTGTTNVAGFAGQVTAGGSMSGIYTYGTTLSAGTEGIANGSPSGSAAFTDSASCNANYAGCVQTNAQMLDITTFSGIDFGIWRMDDGVDTPKLRWAD